MPVKNRFLKPPNYTYYIDLHEVWKNGVEKPVYAKWAAWLVKKSGGDNMRKWDPVRHPGSLEQLGYSLHAPAKVRHQALGKAVRRYGYRKTVEKISFLAGAARISQSYKARARADLNWLKRTYGR